jgi:hypothetical protein
MTTQQLATKAVKSKQVIPVCQICDEKLNKSVHMPIKCVYCDFEACRKCCETYILNETIVKCMNTSCGKEWTRKFIRESFTLTFINGQLKEHKEQILFDKERALLPATQPIVETKIAVSKLDEEIRKIEEKIRALVLVKSGIYQKRAELQNSRRAAPHNAFIRACPDENCRGFLSTQWKCGICEKWTCPDCHIIKGYTRDEEHVCDPDEVATARLLSNDTKPCPKCATGIFKIDGCDQMWCTQCHTAFSWRTGSIQNDIHNPHYYEWLRRTNNGEAPRNRLDVPCGRILGHALYLTLSRAIRANYTATQMTKDCDAKLNQIIRNTIHLNNVERPIVLNYEEKNQNHRVDYLMNRLTEEDFKLQLQRDDKQHHKNQEINDIFRIVVDTVTDILYRFLDYVQSSNTVGSEFNMTILEEINTIVDYANECLADVSRTYSSSRLVLDNKINLYRGKRAIEYIRTLTEETTAVSANI